MQTVRGFAGGLGAFVNHFARILRNHGDEVAIVLTRSEIEPMHVDEDWQAYYRRHGIQLMEVTHPWTAGNRRPNAPFARLSEVVEPVLGGFDIAYFCDWGNTAFHATRKRRFSVEKGPILVTVLHGGNDWVLWGNRRYPAIPGDLYLDFQERYAARYSDFVVSPSRHMVNWLSARNWVFPDEVQVLGLPILSDGRSVAGPQKPARIDRLIFLGRIEKSKGFDIFVEALRILSHRDPELMRDREVILLGAPDRLDPTVGKRVAQEISTLGWPARHVGDKDSSAAIEFLRENATRALCVVPSRADNFPYSVIEASLIAGLNLIACRSGGVGEIFSGGGDKQLCVPWPPALAELLEARLRKPLAASELFRYDAEAANRRWIRFHRQAIERGQRQLNRAPVSLPSVDICIPYYNKPQYLPQLLGLLEHHTPDACQVITVNDGSPDPEAQRTFEAMRLKYRDRGWKFVDQPNSFVDAARNTAVRHGSGDFLIFIDADDLPAPHAVKRMLEAIAISGDDCLMTSSFLFAGDRPPFNASGKITAEPVGLLTPLGADLTTVLVDPFVLGVSMVIIRRSVFEAIGGYREIRGAGHEDWELIVRLVLAGYRVDVLPEYLHFYRQVESSLARTMDEYSAKRRLVDTLDNSANRAGVPGAASVFYGMHLRNRMLEERIGQLERQLRLGDFRSIFISRDFFSPQDGDTSPAPVRLLRNLYRHTVPLERRLEIQRRYVEPVLNIGRRLTARTRGKR